MNDIDLKDLTEGLKKRPNKTWKKAAKRSKDQQLVDELVDTNGADLRKLAKKYEKSTTELVELCESLGIY